MTLNQFKSTSKESFYLDKKRENNSKNDKSSASVDRFQKALLVEHTQESILASILGRT
jgi:hypothetical protein